MNCLKRLVLVLVAAVALPLSGCLGGSGSSSSGSGGGAGGGGSQGGPSAGPGGLDDDLTARACDEQPIPRTGDTLERSYRFQFVDGFNNVDSTLRVTSTTGGTEILGRAEVQRVDFETETLAGAGGAGPGTPSLAASSEFRSRPAPYTVWQHQMISDPDMVLSYEPPLINRFDLDEGQSYEFSTTATTTSSLLPAPSVVELEVTTLYAGRERVSVPAGNILTCLVERSQRTSGPGGTETQMSMLFWFAVGSGVLVRSQLSSDSNPGALETLELTAATFNGNAVEFF